MYGGNLSSIFQICLCHDLQKNRYPDEILIESPRCSRHYRPPATWEAARKLVVHHDINLSLLLIHRVWDRIKLVLERIAIFGKTSATAYLPSKGEATNSIRLNTKLLRLLLRHRVTHGCSSAGIETRLLLYHPYFPSSLQVSSVLLLLIAWFVNLFAWELLWTTIALKC